MTTTSSTELRPLQRSAAAWLIADSWTLTRRTLTHWRQQPFSILMTLAFPLLMVLIFNYMLGGAMAIDGNYTDFLVPGLLVMTMVFGLDSTLQAVTTDLERGVTDRFRSLPMAPGAVLIGRTIADMLTSVVGLALMVGAGWLIGWRPEAGPGAFAGAIALLLLLRFAILWLGVFLGTHAKGSSAVMAAQILEWPLLFLSSIIVSPATMPTWLAVVAEWNPLSATATATRELFGVGGWPSQSWASEHSMVLAIVWPLILIAVFAPLAIRRYQRLGA